MVDQIAAVRAAIDRRISRGISNFVIDLVHRLTATDGSGTPRDTGWAAANWTATIGAARVGTIGTRAAAEQGNVSFGAQRLGLAQLATGYKLEQGDVHVTNNVPYIALLNAVNNPMFVERAIAQAIQKF